MAPRKLNDVRVGILLKVHPWLDCVYSSHFKYTVLHKKEMYLLPTPVVYQVCEGFVTNILQITTNLTTGLILENLKN